MKRWQHAKQKEKATRTFLMRNLRKRVTNGDRRGNTHVISEIKAKYVLQTSSSWELRPISFHRTRATQASKVRPRVPTDENREEFMRLQRFCVIWADSWPRCDSPWPVRPAQLRDSLYRTNLRCLHTQTHLRGGWPEPLSGFLLDQGAVSHHSRPMGTILAGKWGRGVLNLDSNRDFPPLWWRQN